MVAGGGAYAQSMYDINQRQDYQQDRIDRGVRDGQITRSEQYRSSKANGRSTAPRRVPWPTAM